MAWSKLDRVDDFGELSAETDIDEVSECGLGVLVEVLIPESDPVLETNTTRGFIVTLNGLVISPLACSVALICCLFQDVPGAHSSLCRGEDLFDGRDIDSFGPCRCMCLENRRQEHQTVTLELESTPGDQIGFSYRSIIPQALHYA